MVVTAVGCIEVGLLEVRCETEVPGEAVTFMEEAANELAW